MSSLRARTEVGSAPHREPERPTQMGERRADYASLLTITVTFMAASVLGLIALQLLVIHPNLTGLAKYVGLVNQQNQTVKTDVYLAAFFLILPLALIACPRLVDSIASGPNSSALPSLAAGLAGSLAATLIVIRLSGSLPWGSGVKGLLLGVACWSLVVVAVIARAVRGDRWEPLHRLQRTSPWPVAVAAALIFGLLVCLSSARSLGALPLALGAACALVVVIAFDRLRLPTPRRGRWVVDPVVIVLLLLAIPDVVVFRSSTTIPNIYFDPGIVQFQHDYILGPTNQLLGGGALLVNDPVSQYGVGLIYFLAAWFHFAPIGYGTFGFLDGVLTALFYVAAYGVLRIAGVGRTIAAVAIGIATVVLVYNFLFYVGQLPEEGPLRFGLPMLVVLGTTAASRWPGRGNAARVVAFIALGVASVWALEAFVYTLATFIGIVAVETWLRGPGRRRYWPLRQVVLGVGMCAAAHVVFAIATLAGSGHLPDWGQYLAYAREFLFGGAAGSITYGFANWSPGLAVYGGALISAAAIVLLMLRKPRTARSEPTVLVALAGCTAYLIAILSYTDNRSSTYLFLYVALPLVMAGTLWLALLLSPGVKANRSIRRAGLATAMAVIVLLFAGAWPSIGGHFSRTALAHVRPGGGLASAMTRLWHPPPVDPRATDGIRLLDRYMPARRSLILLPTAPDLGTEILIRSGRSNLLPMGDPKADGLVPSVWLPRIRTAVQKIEPGQRVLIDQEALKVIVGLRNPRVNLLKAPIDQGGAEVEWILRELDKRFELKNVHEDPDGLIVAALDPRRAGFSAFGR